MPIATRSVCNRRGLDWDSSCSQESGVRRNDGCGRLTSIFVPTTVVGAGTTVGFPGFPRRAGEGGFRTRPYRRERLSASNIAYRRADTWVRPYGWSRAHPPHRIPHPHRAGEGGFQTRPYRRERLSASTIAYRRADTWVRPYGWARAHPPHPIPLPPVTRGEGVRCELSGCVVGLGFTRVVSGRGAWSRWVRSRGPARASAPRAFP